MALFLACRLLPVSSRGLSSVRSQRERGNLWHLFLSCKDTSHVSLGSQLLGPHLTLISSLLPNTITLRDRAQHMNFGGTQFSPENIQIEMLSQVLDMQVNSWSRDKNPGEVSTQRALITRSLMGHPECECRWGREMVPGLEALQQAEARSTRRIQQRRPREAMSEKETGWRTVVSLTPMEEHVKESNHLWVSRGGHRCWLQRSCQWGAGKWWVEGAQEMMGVSTDGSRVLPPDVCAPWVTLTPPPLSQWPVFPHNKECWFSLLCPVAYSEIHSIYVIGAFILFSFLQYIALFTECNAFEIHSHLCINQWFVHSYCWVVFSCISVSQRFFFYPFASWKTFELFTTLGI